MFCRLVHKPDPFGSFRDHFVALPQHLFTFELDGRQLRNASDCVEQLQLLEELGRVWGQSMLLVVQASKLLLTDIETKVNATGDPQTAEIATETNHRQSEEWTRVCPSVFDVLIYGRGFSQTELESIAISDVLELKAVLDSGAFNSLLTVSVQTRGRNNTSVFVFQCDDVRVRAPTAAISAIGHKHTHFGVINFFPLLFSG